MICLATRGVALDGNRRGLLLSDPRSTGQQSFIPVIQGICQPDLG
jgi:hypothetical protein